MNYPVPPEIPDPGLFEHRSGDCPTHGDNALFARLKGSRERPLCVECMLAAQDLYETTRPK